MSERMQWSEAEAVVRAYRAEHGISEEIDVATLARALGTNVAEVRRLAGRKPRFVDRSGLISAGIAIAVAAFAFTLVGPSFLRQNPLFASLMPTPAMETSVDLAATPQTPAIASVYIGRRDSETHRFQMIEVRRRENL